jgi:hypothetical protein
MEQTYFNYSGEKIFEYQLTRSRSVPAQLRGIKKPSFCTFRKKPLGVETSKWWFGKVNFSMAERNLVD